MKLCCSNCRYESSMSGFFRREKTVARGLRRTVCFGCRPPGPLAKGTIRYLWSGAILAAGGVLVAGTETLATSGMWFLFSGSLGVWSPVIVAIHELGHVAAALVVGHRIDLVVIGGGEPWAAFEVRGVPVRLGQDQQF